MIKKSKFNHNIHQLILKFNVFNFPFLICAKSINSSILTLYFDREHRIFINFKYKTMLTPENTCSYLLNNNIKIGTLDLLINELAQIIEKMSHNELGCLARHFYSFNDKREPVYVDNNGCNFYPLPNNLIIEFPYIMKWREFNL